MNISDTIAPDRLVSLSENLTLQHIQKAIGTSNFVSSTSQEVYARLGYLATDKLRSEGLSIPSHEYLPLVKSDARFRIIFMRCLAVKVRKELPYLKHFSYIDNLYLSGRLSRYNSTNPFFAISVKYSQPLIRYIRRIGKYITEANLPVFIYCSLSTSPYPYYYLSGPTVIPDFRTHIQELERVLQLDSDSYIRINFKFDPTSIHTQETPGLPDTYRTVPFLDIRQLNFYKILFKIPEMIQIIRTLHRLSI